MTSEIAWIPLTKGYVAKVDADRYNELTEWGWYALATKAGHVYAGRHAGHHDPVIMMHRALLGPTDSRVYVDHINGDGLDNRLENLRLASNSENQRNTGLRKTNTSGHKGVHWSESRQRWMVTLRIGGGKKIHRSCRTLQEAVEVYRELVAKYHGDFARTEPFQLSTLTLREHVMAARDAELAAIVKSLQRTRGLTDAVWDYLGLERHPWLL